MKAKVLVTMRAEVEVEIDVEYSEGEDPTDLSNDEENEAADLATSYVRDADWYIERRQLISE